MASLFKLTVLLLLVFPYCHGISSVMRKTEKATQDAWIWPGVKKVGIHLTFSETADWSDLFRKRIEQGFYSVGKFCVRGAFILYNEPFFQVRNPDGFEIVSGNIKCIRLAQNTKSIQRLGSVGSITRPSITFFEKVNFGSQAHPTVVNVGGYFFQRMRRTRSAVMIGDIPWTIHLSNGNAFCIVPDFDPEEKRPICMIRDFRLLVDVTDNSVRIVRASQGCKKDVLPESIFKIQDCQFWGKPRTSGTGKLLDELAEKDDSQLAGRTSGIQNLNENVTSVAKTSGGNFCSNDEKANWIFRLYKIAISQTSNALVVADYGQIGKHIWKLDLLDWMFALVKRIVPNDLVYEKFLHFTRELFVDKLVNEWNKNADSGKGTEDPMFEKDYANLIGLTENCVSQIEQKPDDIIANFQALLQSTPTKNDIVSKIDPQFQRRPDLDIIIETVWLVGHMTGYYCHRVYILKFHYWALYFKTFMDLYIMPLASKWTIPTEGLQIIFGGMDYNFEYDKLAMFVTDGHVSTQELFTLQRPLEKKMNETSPN